MAETKNKQLEVDAAEIRIRAERRLGELIKAQKETVGLAKPGPKPEIGSAEEPNYQPTLAEAGIDKKLSSRAQKMAAVSDPREPIGCRWIEADLSKDWGYCQRPQRRRSSFCPEHHQRAYFDPRKREEARQEAAE